MEQHPHLSLSQRNAVDIVLTSRDQMMAWEGVAGAGKTTSLAAVREAAVSAGYEVEGLAPTSRAVQKLGEAGMETHTLQHHLARGYRADGGQQRLYVIDESSMASTKQMHTFVERLKENDRVLFVGDTRQHEAVEAGRPYVQLQEAGLRTARFDEIIRQKDPELKEVVEQLARGEVRDAIGNLNEQGRVHEIGMSASTGSSDPAILKRLVFRANISCVCTGEANSAELVAASTLYPTRLLPRDIPMQR